MEQYTCLASEVIAYTTSLARAQHQFVISLEFREFTLDPYLAEGPW